MTSYESPLSGHWPYDRPSRFTSCCLSREGNLALSRVQHCDCLETKTAFLSNGRFALSTRDGVRAPSSETPMPRFCVDLEMIQPHGLHLILWDCGVPYMFGILVPTIRELAGLDAVGWFSREHELSLTAFLASVREVRLADEELPLLLTIFNARGPRSLPRLEGHWRLMESIAFGGDLHRRSASKGFARMPVSGVEDRVQCHQLALSAICPEGKSRLPIVNRLSSRFPSEES